VKDKLNTGKLQKQ